MASLSGQGFVGKSTCCVPRRPKAVFLQDLFGKGRTLCPSSRCGAAPCERQRTCHATRRPSKLLCQSHVSSRKLHAAAKANVHRRATVTCLLMSFLTEICDRHCKCTEGSPYIPFSTDCALKYPRRLRSSTACIVCAIRLMQCELSSNTRVYIQVCCGEQSEVVDRIPPKLLFCFQISTATVAVHYAVHPTRNSRHTETSLGCCSSIDV